jgi:hypothetical protein
MKKSWSDKVVDLNSKRLSFPDSSYNIPNTFTEQTQFRMQNSWSDNTLDLNSKRLSFLDSSYNIPYTFTE